MVHKPWWVIGAWVVLAAVVLRTAPPLPSSTDESDALPRDYESIQAANPGQRAFPSAFTPSMILVFQRGDEAPLNTADSAKVAEVVRGAEGKHISNVEQILPGRPSPNNLVQVGAVKMPQFTQSNIKDLTDSAKKLRAELKGLASNAGLKVGTTGSVAQQLDSQEASGSGDAVVFLATVLLILILLLVIFRSPIVALLPVVLIGIVSRSPMG